jgi:N utilization substance protein A
MPKKKSVRKKTRKKKPARTKTVKKVAARPKVAARMGKPVRAKGRKKKSRIVTRGTASPAGSIALPQRGLGAAAGGQSGDIEGLSSRASADSESVEELAEEGQSFEAEAVRGVEDAPDPDEAEVTTHEVPEDDVPAEYLDEE